jgi:hypothetical protein
MPFIGQTNRSLKPSYQDLIRYVEQNNPRSAYALHVINNKHEYSPINDTVKILKHINKTTLLIPLEQLYIQSYATFTNSPFHTTHSWSMTYTTRHFPPDQPTNTPTSTQPKTGPTLIVLVAGQRRWHVQGFYYTVRTYCIFWNTFIIQTNLNIIWTFTYNRMLYTFSDIVCTSISNFTQFNIFSAW